MNKINYAKKCFVQRFFQFDEGKSIVLSSFIILLVQNLHWSWRCPWRILYQMVHPIFQLILNFHRSVSNPQPHVPNSLNKLSLRPLRYPTCFAQKAILLMSLVDLAMISKNSLSTVLQKKITVNWSCFI